MERETTYFFVLLGAMLVLTGSAWHYEKLSHDQLQADYTAKIGLISKELADIKQEYDARISQQSVALTSMDDKIAQTATSVHEELQSNVHDIQSSLHSVELKSDQKISELESKLLKINVQSQDFTSTIKDVIDSVVSIQTDTGGGSGVIIDPQGYIVTNYHVIAGASQVQVKTFKQKTYPATLVGFNPKVDVAVLKINDGIYQALKWGNSDNVDVGEKVIALGSPGGLDFTVTEGIVSAKRKDSKGVDYLQIDVPVNPGNSGGPIVDQAGKIVGITEIKITEFEGIGFAIAADDAQNAVGKIMQGVEGNGP